MKNYHKVYTADDEEPVCGMCDHFCDNFDCSNQCGPDYYWNGYRRTEVKDSSVPISVETFSSKNRTKKCGKSMYRICNTDPAKGTGKWYIHEEYEEQEGNSFYNSSLQKVLDVFNNINKEKVVINCTAGKR